MRDLDEAIAQWRHQMLSVGIKSPAVLDELESHLRDDIARQMQSGVNAQQAFGTAIVRIGEARVLMREFGKIHETSRKQMKRLLTIFAALLGMVFGLSMVLPQLGQWSRTGVMRSVSFLLLGVALVIIGGSMAWYAIRTHREARGRRLISIGLAGACGFYATPFILAFFQDREMDLMGWIFCAGLAAASVLFFGSCFHLNRQLPPAPVHEG